MKIKESNGITLMALVIIIIVLITLTGISINLLLGENGIIEKAQYAKSEYLKSAINEEKHLESLEVNIDVVTKEKKLKEVVTSKNYGDFVKYDIDLNDDGDYTNDWRIFYNNGKNVFIIAADYVKNTKIDTTSLNFACNKGYSVYWKSTPNESFIDDNIANKYMINKLSSLYEPSSGEHNNNYKYLSTLLDTSKFQNFVINSKAEDAIGGPSIEMWCDSWNSVYPKDKISCNRADLNGYYIDWGSDANSTTYIDGDDMKTKEGFNNSLYFHQNGIDNCWGYWIASPSASYSSGLFVINCAGYINSQGGTENIHYGLRPIVCLKTELISTINEKTGVWEL